LKIGFDIDFSVHSTVIMIIHVVWFKQLLFVFNN